MKVTPNQMKMLRRIYRLSLARHGMGNTVWVHEFDLHKGSMQVLKRLELVQEEVASDIPMPPHTNPPGWNARYRAYILTQKGLKFVKDNTPILIGEHVRYAGNSYAVVGWADDYTSLELENKRCCGVFVSPNMIEVIGFTTQ